MVNTQLNNRIEQDLIRCPGEPVKPLARENERRSEIHQGHDVYSQLVCTSGIRPLLYHHEESTLAS